jgi:hypothetical protein
MVLEGPYVPSFATDIAGGPPGLGVRPLLLPAVTSLPILPHCIARCTGICVPAAVPALLCSCTAHRSPVQLASCWRPIVRC